MDKNKIKKMTKRIKHFFIQTKADINVDGIHWDEDEVAFFIRIPYHSLSKGFTRFLNLITLRKKYTLDRNREYYTLEFPKPKEEEEFDVNEVSTTTSSESTATVPSMYEN